MIHTTVHHLPGGQPHDWVTLCVTLCFGCSGCFFSQDGGRDEAAAGAADESGQSTPAGWATGEPKQPFTVSVLLETRIFHS